MPSGTSQILSCAGQALNIEQTSSAHPASHGGDIGRAGRARLPSLGVQASLFHNNARMQEHR